MTESLPQSAVGWSAVCDCGISRSYLLFVPESDVRARANCLDCAINLNACHKDIYIIRVLRSHIKISRLNSLYMLFFYQTSCLPGYFHFKSPLNILFLNIHPKYFHSIDKAMLTCYRTTKMTLRSAINTASIQIVF